MAEQLAAHGPDKARTVLVKTVAKMSPAGRAEARALGLAPDLQALVDAAVVAVESGAG